MGFALNACRSILVSVDELSLLLVVSSPDLETKPRKGKLDVSVGVNQPINLSCVVQPAEASRLPVNVSWTSQETKLTYSNVSDGAGPQHKAEPYAVSSATAAAHTLVFEAIERKYRGEYTCTATMAGVGSISSAPDKPTRVLIRVKGASSLLSFACSILPPLLLKILVL